VKYRVIVADDEKPARRWLIQLLKEHEDFVVVAEAENGDFACEVIEKHKPELAFLDIQMPGQTGIEVALKTHHKPFVIFVTAFDQFALEAFKALAVDYLLKPVEGEGLHTALDKFKRIVRQVHNQREVLNELAGRMGGNGRDRISVSTGDSIKILPHDDIICFEADNKYTTVFTRKGEFLTEMSLVELENSLPGEKFVRIHRKHIVNMKFIDEICKWFDRRMKVKLNVPFNRELIVGREYIDRIRNN